MPSVVWAHTGTIAREPSGQAGSVEANGQGNVVADIPIWRSFTGQSEHEVQGRGWMDSIHPDDRAKARELWDHAVKTRCIYETEYRLRKYDGTHRYFGVRAVPIFSDATAGVSDWSSPDFSLRGVPLAEAPAEVTQWVGI